jgi:drug/metabolite transporter (DMT)-like permease
VVSIVAPVAATAPIVPLAVGIALGEVPGPIQCAGIALAVGGIVITVCRSNPRAAPGPAVGPSIALGLLCALGFGGFYVAMDGASEGEIPWALLIARATAVSLFVATAALTRSAPAVLSTMYPIVTVALARLYMHEPVDRRQGIGIAICICGMAAISAAA